MSDLAKRIISALIAAPVALIMIYLGGLPLATFLAAVSAGCAWEFYRIAAAGGVEPLDPVGIPLAGAVPDPELPPEDFAGDTAFLEESHSRSRLQAF